MGLPPLSELSSSFCEADFAVKSFLKEIACFGGGILLRKMLCREGGPQMDRLWRSAKSSSEVAPFGPDRFWRWREHRGTCVSARSIQDGLFMRTFEKIASKSGVQLSRDLFRTNLEELWELCYAVLTVSEGGGMRPKECWLQLRIWENHSIISSRTIECKL